MSRRRTRPRCAPRLCRTTGRWSSCWPSYAPLLLATDQRELRALRVAADDDPVAGRHLVRAHLDRSALVLRDPLRRRDRRHADVEAEVRLAGRTVEERAEALAVMVDEAVLADLAHIHEIVRDPAELVAVES